jgi:hypothetical protein
LLVAFGVCPAASAVDAFHVELGAGDDDAKRAGLYFSWSWNAKWFAHGDWYLGGHWELGGSYWDASPGRTGNDSLGEGGAAAVFRLEPHKPMSGFSPFLELGLGVHGYTDTELEDKDFDIAFTFAEHIGTGIRFGDEQRWELGYRYQHLSNAGLGDENPGINFHLVRLGFRF